MVYLGLKVSVNEVMQSLDSCVVYLGLKVSVNEVMQSLDSCVVYLGLRVSVNEVMHSFKLKTVTGTKWFSTGYPFIFRRELIFKKNCA